MKKLVFLFTLIFFIACSASPQKVDLSIYNLSGKVTSGIRVIEVESFKYSYSPDVVVVNSGERVRIKLSTRDTEHGFNIPEIDFNLKVKKGGTAEGEFTAPKPGIYEIRCSVFCGSGHKKMKARLVVR